MEHKGWTRIQRVGVTAALFVDTAAGIHCAICHPADNCTQKKSLDSGMVLLVGTLQILVAFSILLSNW